ncbi:HflC protein [Solemya pervernicosa gill symbiont]|uniref:Protein HflC n=2 Tax=Gammaproteobacteria incertae sedis TaxID=118884 RepID=A0A1T2L812_9GAMM|nr:protease modulator HflC [Candidatus Reidiella endopervernicosa]OOZ41086.1 HflC protein [Solemya pervernicosa gill symbiont]QKQ26247.1 protease modulator HflC [Candidatus Reidiella endopervernicosa]
MFQNRSLIGFISLVVLLIVGLSVFTVDQRQRGILFRLGEIVDTSLEPGLHFKLPFVNNVRKFDVRILTLDAEPERFLTSEKKNVIVDFFVKWRITDIARYYKATTGDERQASIRLSQIIKDGLRGEFGKRTIQEVVSGERSQIMDIITVEANRGVAEFGIEVVDVRIKRIDLPREVSDSVYQRMQAERARVAKDFRARGAEAAERIRADADRQRSVIVAKAYSEAEKIRGEGDATAAEIYAKAYEKDGEFYAFTRSLNAYRNAFQSKDDVVVLKPDSEFFQYYKDANGKR